MSDPNNPWNVMPCPFCGEKTCLEADLQKKHPMQRKHGWHIRCETCGARGPMLDIPHGGLPHEKVVAAWNRRTPAKDKVKP